MFVLDDMPFSIKHDGGEVKTISIKRHRQEDDECQKSDKIG